MFLFCSERVKPFDARAEGFPTLDFAAGRAGLAAPLGKDLTKLG
jgi:hypothetical protein